MEIIVLDIETTGFSEKWDSIVEIGISLVNTKTKTRELIFDNLIKEDGFQPNWDKHKNAWIFNNSDLTIDDVINARPLSDYFDELQEIFTNYPATAFNCKFDFGFMRSRGFKINDVKCLMLTSQKYVSNKGKWPSVIEAYEEFFPDETDWNEKHRGGSDAMDEAKILIHLCELKEHKLNVRSSMNSH